MSNKGVTNHIRFRTKFWQERQLQQQQRDSFTSQSIVTGEKMTRFPFENPAARKISKSPRREEAARRPTGESCRRDSRMALKLELMSLTI